MGKSLKQSWTDTRASWERSRHITIPAPVPARPAQPGKHRVAFFVYRGNPTCGGQGVYTRHLTRELVALGHQVEVFAGQPWPELDEGVGFTPVPGLDLYRDPDPFRVPALREFKTWADWTEFLIMMAAGFGEPLAFSKRIRKIMRTRRADFDICSNSCFRLNGGTGIQNKVWPISIAKPPEYRKKLMKP